MEIKEKELKVAFDSFFNLYLFKLKGVIDSINPREVEVAAELIAQSYEKEGFIYLFGNGGSGSTASHFVTDFNKVVSQSLDRRLKCVCLNDNIPSLLAISNDIGYAQIFKFQLENYLTPDDLVIGISGSGNSPNVVEAIRYARCVGAKTLGIVGFDGGEVKKLASHSIHIKANQMQYVEDCHLILNHLLGNYLKIALQGDTA